MSQDSQHDSGLLAGIMGLGIAVGLGLYLYLAFVRGIPGFESAPAISGSMLLALIIVTLVARSRR